MDAINAYKVYFAQDAALQSMLPALFAKTLGCWCDPLPCHGQVLIEAIKEKLYFV
jgi:hypothetical protein